MSDVTGTLVNLSNYFPILGPTFDKNRNFPDIFHLCPECDGTLWRIYTQNDGHDVRYILGVLWHHESIMGRTRFAIVSYRFDLVNSFCANRFFMTFWVLWRRRSERFRCILTHYRKVHIFLTFVLASRDRIWNALELEAVCVLVRLVSTSYVFVMCQKWQVDISDRCSTQLAIRIFSLRFLCVKLVER